MPVIETTNLVNPTGAYTQPTLPTAGQFASLIQNRPNNNLIQSGGLTSVSQPTVRVTSNVTRPTQADGVLGGGFGNMPARGTGTMGMPPELYRQYVVGTRPQRRTTFNAPEYRAPRQFIGPAPRQFIGPPTPPGYETPRILTDAQRQEYAQRGYGSTGTGRDEKLYRTARNVESTLRMGGTPAQSQIDWLRRSGIGARARANAFADVSGGGSTYSSGYGGYGYGGYGYSPGRYSGSSAPYYGGSQNTLNWRVATG